MPHAMQAKPREMTSVPRTSDMSTDPPHPDHLLVAAAQADRKNFAALYTKYHDSVARFIYQRTGAKEEALDITQQVFMQAMIALDRYESRGFAFSSWLYRIALNEVNSRYRKTKRQRVVNIDDTAIREVMAELNDAESRRSEDDMLQALQQLDEEDMQLIELRFFEKRGFKEIAEISDMGESAVKMKVYRLLDKLKGIIEKKQSAE